MPKKKKGTINKPPKSVAPQRQQQIPIENKSSEELALLLGEQYKMVMQSQNNITAINSVLVQRKQAIAQKAKETTDGKHRD